MGVPKKEKTKERVREGLREDRKNKERAKQIILQVLRQSEIGTLGKTKLFKAFWLAHLLYSQKNPGYLSTWKIVKMPHGPGIDRGDPLILELKNSGHIRLAHEPKGPVRTETVCMLLKDPPTNLLPPGAIDAIKSAYGIVQTQSADQISEWSHAYSRSWNQAQNGEELNIYSDVIPDDVYEERKQTLEEISEAYEDLFK